MTDRKHTHGKLEIVMDNVLLEVTDDGSVNAVCDAHNRADAERLTDCWNALAGIDDPAAFMAAAQKAVDTYSMLECSDAVTAMGKHMKGSDK